MAVKIRLTRMGKKKQPSYRVVVVDSRKARDSAYIEQIGRYDPREQPSLVEIDNDRALDWLSKGAQPTERAKKLLEISGAWTAFRVSKGDIHTVDTADAAGGDAPAAAASGHVPEVHVVGDAEEATADVAAEADAGPAGDAAPIAASDVDEAPVAEDAAVETVVEALADEPAGESADEEESS